MDFTSKGLKRRRQKVRAESLYISSLHFYTEPPTGNVTLTNFDELAMERLKILRTVERINLSGQIRSSEDWMNRLYDDFVKNKYFIIVAEKILDGKGDEILEARRRDRLSHFILRLAYCRTEDLRKWFIAQETDLFRARFMRAATTGTDFTEFLKANSLHFLQISEEELQAEIQNLVAGTYNINGFDQIENKIFYKVPFTQALELVRTRKVFIKGGFAYVPGSDLVTLVASVFRTKLSHAVALTNRALPQLDDDERLVTLLQDFDKRYTGKDYTQKKAGRGAQITPEMINHLSLKSFPLCMKNMQDHLRIDNHLKHGGRMQYSLFLKAAGLSLEDALQFWRSHFTKVMDVDKFEKQYAYSIRHNYGKEGKRTDYTPYSCVKIITSSVGPGDAHGCPFRHFDSSVLHQKLIGYRIPQQAITEIMDLVSRSHYQIACQRYFEATHSAVLESGINHPNQYFEESMALLHGTKTPSKDLSTSQIKTQKSVMMVDSQTSPKNASMQESQKADISGVEDLLFDDDDMDDSIFQEIEAK